MNMLIKLLIYMVAFLAVGVLAESRELETIASQYEDLRETVEMLVSNQKEQQKTIGNQQETINDLLEQNGVMAGRIKQLEGAQSNKLKVPFVQDEYQSFGCLLEAIELSCPSSYSINITNAFYGQSPLNCSEQCCVPNPDDCKEEVPENSLADWSILLNACNGNQNCSFTYEGAVINECREDYIADYMEILHDCLMDVGDHGPVGFSAYATSDGHYDDGDIIKFDATVSNIGNHYNEDTYKFTCPYTGLFLFTVNIVSYSSSEMIVQLVHENNDLVGTLSYVDDANAATATAVIECSVGDSVWVRCDSDNDYMYEGYKSSHFTGALIHAYV